MTNLARAVAMGGKSLAATNRRVATSGIEIFKSWQHTDAVAMPNPHPPLAKVPSLPIIGSMIPQYSDTFSFLPQDHLQSFPKMREKFGDFYKFGYPGMGGFWDPTVYVLQDPHEYARILRYEGQYPSGSSQYLWPNIQYVKDNNLGRTMAIVSQGPEWKRIRTFAQTDLLAPKSAARYLPAIITAAEHASKGAQESRKNFFEYLNRCAFDMANSFLMGRFPRTADPTFESDPEDIGYCKSLSTALGALMELLLDPGSRVMVQFFGIKNASYKKFEDNLSESYRISEERVKEILKKRENGTLSMEEEFSYINRAIERREAQSDQEDPIQMDELMGIIKVLISASVDGTTVVTAWNIIHLAQHPDIQERVREEVMEAVSKTGGRLTEETFNHSTFPLMAAVIRESHRLTPLVVLLPSRVIPEVIEVHGENVPGGSTLMFDGYSQGVDPNLVDDPYEFRPERFFPEAVAARKGTKSEVLDHPLMSTPFAQGARRCPGSRVAVKEMTVILAQLLMDWKITTDVKDWRDISISLQSGLAPVMPELHITPTSK